jgi:hypothetical protein
MPRCQECERLAAAGRLHPAEVELATKGTYHMIEIPRPPGEWREFRDAGELIAGCAKHPPESFSTYIDGRVIRTANAIPERVPEAQKWRQ